MNEKKTRLVVADPSLVDARGHHFTLTLQVSRGARLQGVEVVWFTHKDFVTKDPIEGVTIYPVFSATMYDRYRPEKRDMLPSRPHEVLLNELDLGISHAGICAEDHILFHTGYSDLFLAAPSYAASNWRDRPFLHICTPYDLETMPGKDGSTDLLDVFKRMRTIEAVDKKLFFWAETPQLATYYTLRFCFNVRALPLPPPHNLMASGVGENEGTVKALYLGAAREEKGFLLLPQIVERLYYDYGQNGKLQFQIQCTPQIVGYIPTIKTAIEKLSEYPDSYVSLIKDVLDEHDYRRYLLESDVVLLLYDKKNYRIRGSGIAVEAICADKCVLTHRGTFCASLLTHGGGEAVQGVDEAVAKLVSIVEARDTYRERAKIQGKEYRSANSVESYVGRILSQATQSQSVPFFPSAIIGQVSPSLLRLN